MPALLLLHFSFAQASPVLHRGGRLGGDVSRAPPRGTGTASGVCTWAEGARMVQLAQSCLFSSVKQGP